MSTREPIGSSVGSPRQAVQPWQNRTNVASISDEARRAASPSDGIWAVALSLNTGAMVESKASQRRRRCIYPGGVSSTNTLHHPAPCTWRTGSTRPRSCLPLPGFPPARTNGKITHQHHKDDMNMSARSDNPTVESIILVKAETKMRGKFRNCSPLKPKQYDSSKQKRRAWVTKTSEILKQYHFLRVMHEKCA